MIRESAKQMKFLSLALLIPLGACSYLSPITGGSENGGTVNYVVTRYGEDAAMDAAKDHCSKYDRNARELRLDAASNTMTFTCEVPEKAMPEGSKPL